MRVELLKAARLRDFNDAQILFQKLCRSPKYFRMPHDERVHVPMDSLVAPSVDDHLGADSRRIAHRNGQNWFSCYSHSKGEGRGGQGRGCGKRRMQVRYWILPAAN